ncbi:MAG: hypothetical protein F6K14_17950 [Symploca sp. SIO2C1]|nr:hypothetical protein [Symploca sp. SIO2C1]
MKTPQYESLRLLSDEETSFVVGGSEMVADPDGFVYGGVEGFLRRIRIRNSGTSSTSGTTALSVEIGSKGKPGGRGEPGKP